MFKQVCQFAKMWGLNRLTTDAIREQIISHLVVTNYYEHTLEGQQQPSQQQIVSARSKSGERTGRNEDLILI